MKMGDVFYVRKDHYRYGDSMYEQVVVKGETSRSWVLGDVTRSYHDFKVPKCNPFKDRKMYTEQQMNDQVFLDRYSYKVAETLRRHQDATVLRQVMHLLGVTEESYPNTAYKG